MPRRALRDFTKKIQAQQDKKTYKKGRMRQKKGNTTSYNMSTANNTQFSSNYVFGNLPANEFTQRLSKGQRRRRNRRLRKEAAALQRSEALRTIIRQQVQESAAQHWGGTQNLNFTSQNQTNNLNTDGWDIPNPRPHPTQGWGSDEYFREQQELQQRERGTQSHDIYFANNFNNIQTDGCVYRSSGFLFRGIRVRGTAH